MDTAERTEPAGEGKITRLVAQKKNPNRVSVYLDGAYAFGVHGMLIADFRLSIGRVLTEAERRKLAEADAVLRAKAVALNYIAYRPRTEREVRRKLAEKGFSDDFIAPVIERLYALGYLDDAAYARNYAHARYANKGYGPQRIRTELLRRGVNRALVDATVDELTATSDPLEAARSYAEKRWQRLAGETDSRKRLKKLSDFLVRRGFTYDTVRRVLAELTEGDTDR